MSTVKKVGRPSYAPTDKDKVLVALAIGHGMKQEQVARLIGVSVPTLRLHFSEELEFGTDKLEVHYWSRLYALSQLRDGTGLKATIFALQSRFGVSQYAPRVPKEPELGKKEAANRDAQVAHKDDPEWGELVDAVH